MGQSRRWSLFESIAGTFIGYAVNFVAGPPLYHLFFGVNVGIGENFGISVAFTIISLVRGYYVRRGFNKLHAYMEKQ
jgi:hypothetical protein